MATGAVGLAFESVLVRRVYGSHLRQILITMGGLIVIGQLVVALWGPQPLAVAKPAAAARQHRRWPAPTVERYRLAAVAVGLAVFAGMELVLNRTRIGLLVRAGVENREMVEALGYRIRRLFVLVFVAGAALAGIGGVMWADYQEVVTAAIGGEMTILVFIIVIIGGLGSVTGCFTGAVLVGLVSQLRWASWRPELALGSNIAADGGGAAVAAARAVSAGWPMSPPCPAHAAWRCLISGDAPGHPVASALVAVLVVGAGVVPFALPGTRRAGRGGAHRVFVVLAASYDILLGYTGIVSLRPCDVLRHRRLRGGDPAGQRVGGLGRGLARRRRSGWRWRWWWRPASACSACACGRSIFSMITLAVASFAQLLASQWRGLTGGEDGLTLRACPCLLTPAFRLFTRRCSGVRVDGRMV